MNDLVGWSLVPGFIFEIIFLGLKLFYGSGSRLVNFLNGLRSLN
jgi:hypothetical protein